MNWRDLNEWLLNAVTWMMKLESGVPSIPIHPDWGLPTAAEEIWADEWMRNFPTRRELPTLTDRERYVLLPRLRYAAVTANLHAKLLPHESVPDPTKELVKWLVDDWHHHNREYWLTAPRFGAGDQN
jgi:hypothetical protein